MFTISVVIPVYNAGPYIRTAVESALQQPEVGEVVLVEDKSPDDSLTVCRALAAEYDKVRLFQHPNGENRGAGATRNLGMQSVRFDYIAFLDADDYYFPDRFRKTREVFEAHPDADGVYEAAGVYDPGDDVNYKMFSVTRALDPGKLFHYLLRGTYGHFQTNTLTFRRTLLDRSGIFNTDLRLHQDSELWLRMAFYGRLYAGKLDKPVTYIRRHENNRITHAKATNRLQFWQVVIDHFVDRRMSRVDYTLILWKYCQIRAKVNKTSPLKEFMAVWKTDGRKVKKVFAL